MKWQPHNYQKHAIKFMLEHGAAGLFLDPGMGKSSTTLAAFKILKREKLVDRMLVIAPLRPAHSVWPAEVQKWDDFKDLSLEVLHGPDKAEKLASAPDICVINPEGLPWLFGQFKGKRVPFEMLVIDECFPAGTLISTEHGQVPIEAVQVGQLVKTSSGLRRVTRLNSRKTLQLVRLQLSDGRLLNCTSEHPVFTDVGWLPAILTEGREVYDEAALSGLQKNFSEGMEGDENWRQGVLLAILRSEADVAQIQSKTTRRGVSADVCSIEGQAILEQRASMVGGAQEKGLGSGEGCGADVQRARRQREGVGDGSVGAQRLAEEVHLELRDRIGRQAAWLSYLLQSGLRRSEDEVCAGGGRIKSQQLGLPVSGSKEGGEAVRTRVVRVSHFELGSEASVFNLEVEGCPHYFAEGFLVHNCTKFKHTNTQRFKCLRPWLPYFRRRYALTGTPAPNGLLDLFGQIYVLDLGNALGRYITHYRQQYFDQTGFGGYTWVPRRGAEEAIYDRLKPLVLRMSGEDYLKLPPLVNNTVTIQLPDKARKAYAAMEALLLAEVEGKTVTAANAAAATGKCRQIANGGAYHEAVGQRRSWANIHTAKVEAVQELVEELNGKPALVAYEYQHDLERLQEAFPEAPYLGGGLTPKRQREIEAAWNAGQLPVLFAQPQSVAHGLNLQGVGAAVIWHSLTWDLELYEQLVRRVWRQGQKERVVVHHIVAEKTVDEVVMRGIAKKDRTQKALLSALAGYLRQR